jgi:hypothetical protein
MPWRVCRDEQIGDKMIRFYPPTSHFTLVVWHLTIIGWRRFFVPELRNRAAVSRAQKNVGEQNTTKGVRAPKRTPGWYFANPEPPSGDEALTVC